MGFLRPYTSLKTVLDSVDDLFTDGHSRLGNFTSLRPRYTPLNIRRKGDDLEIEVAVPGFAKEDLSISFEKDLLSISGETKSENESKPNTEGESSIHEEFTQSSFTRTVRLNEDLDTANAEANYDNGVLTITIPRGEEAQSKQLPIN